MAVLEKSKILIGTTVLVIALASAAIAEPITVGHAGSAPTLADALKIASKNGGDAEIRIEESLTGEALSYRWAASLTSLEITAARGVVVSGQNQSDKTWLDIFAPIGRSTNIVIHGFTVRGYGTAISIAGTRERPADGWNGGNKIYHMVFDDVGARGDAEASTAVVRFVNSRGGLIARNRFTNVYNDQTCGLIHAVYLAHHSSGNVVEDNNISTRCMDPFRVRDQSDNNTFRRNVVIGKIPTALYTEWFCKTGCTKKSSPECPSSGNAYADPGTYVLFKNTAPSGPLPSGC
jgi:hypothetical protein